MKILFSIASSFALVAVMFTSSPMLTVGFAEDAQCPAVRSELDYRLNQQQELRETGSLGSLTMDEEERTIENLDTYLADARDAFARLGCDQ
ncbi:MAG: hypothetical protein Rhims3KO_00830 [Hyphomicrobiales bacterium]